MKTLRSGLFALPPILLGVFVAIVLFGGCGGGSSSSSGGGTPGDSVTVNFADASRAVAASPMVTRLATMNMFSDTRSRHNDTCPTYSFSVNGATVDFGSGCYSPEFGERVWGKITATVVKPTYDSDGYLINFDRVTLSVNNLGSAQRGTYNGTMSFRTIGQENALGFDCDLRLRHRCEERLTLSGVATYERG